MKSRPGRRPTRRRKARRNARRRKPKRRNAGASSKKTGDGKDEKPPPDDATFNVEVERLSWVSGIAYQRARTEVVKRFKVPLAFLDAEVRAAREARSGGGTDGLPKIEPWPHLVDGEEVFNELAAVLRRHIRLPTRAEDATALWIGHTHCMDAWDTTPRLGVTSATYRCGKSNLLELIALFVPAPLPSVGITPAGLYRTVEEWKPTLLVDEADAFLANSEELRGIMNAGHKRSSANVVRMVGDDHKPHLFSCWAPLAIAKVGKLPPSLDGRAINIRMQRLLPGELVERLRMHHKLAYADLGSKLARWAIDNLEALCDPDPEMPEGIANRDADNWRPLLAIADRIGGAWGGPAGRGREAALTLNQVDSGQTVLIMLLEDMRTIMNGEDIASEELAAKLSQIETRPWPEFGRQAKSITPPKIAGLLAPLGIAPRNIRFPDDVQRKGYRFSDLEEVFRRYLSS
jgi:putative DNA primase/helicase